MNQQLISPEESATTDDFVDSTVRLHDDASKSRFDLGSQTRTLHEDSTSPPLPLSSLWYRSRIDHELFPHQRSNRSETTLPRRNSDRPNIPIYRETCRDLLLGQCHFWFGFAFSLLHWRVSLVILGELFLFRFSLSNSWDLAHASSPHQGFLLGALLPFVPWFLYRRSGNRFWKQISVPLLLHGVSSIPFLLTLLADSSNSLTQSIGPPQTPMNVLIPGFLVSFLSQFYALRYRPKWFERYNYVLSSALDAGTSINALVIYIFGLGTFFTWWGNSSIDTEHCVPG